ncbi:MAG: hypothetical protein MK194_13660 [Roseibacillus sp.]|nr:hypothetical protein [Roseibacillus sp.]
MKKSTFNQIVSSLSTIAWGIVPVYLYARGLISEYLSESFHLIALSGGLAMIVLGAFNLIHARREMGCGHDHSHEHEEGCDHEHDHEQGHDHHEQNPLAALCLMLLPVILCTGFTKHEYSKEALRWKGLYKQRTLRSLYSNYNAEFTRELLEKRTPKTKEGNFLLQLSELYWSAGDEKIMKVYEGLPAQLEGRLIEEEPKLNTEGNRKRLYRVVMTCCAADAQVLGVPLQFSNSLPALEDKKWITARGKVAFESIDGQYFAYLRDCEVEATEPPDPKEQRRR